MVGSDHFHQLWLDNMPQFLVGKARPHGPDPELDAKAVEWIGQGEMEGCLREVTLESLHAPGNATHGFMDFMLMMGLAGAVPADYADNLDLFHTTEAYFTWYPNGVGG